MPSVLLWTSCGTQRLLRPLSGPCILLATAPTAPPCFGRRPQSSPLQYQRKNYFFFICKLEKSADFSKLLFHERGSIGEMHLFCGTTGSFSEDRPLGWDPVAAGNRAGDGMARFVSEEKATRWPACYSSSALLIASFMTEYANPRRMRAATTRSRRPSASFFM